MFKLFFSLAAIVEKKNRKYPPNIIAHRERKRSPSLDYIDISSSRLRGGLIFWIIGDRWKIEADPGEYPWNDFARSFYLVPRLAEFGTRAHG